MVPPMRAKIPNIYAFAECSAFTVNKKYSPSNPSMVIVICRKENLSILYSIAKNVNKIGIKP